MDARKPYDRLPRVLVTGFSVFPGAPVNPTEALIGILEARRVELAGIADLHTETLAVEYLSVADRLDRWAVDIRPDIAIHFGLSARAHGFTLERIAKNVAGTDRPDNAGHTPADPLICAGPESFTSTLPLAGIRDALAARSLPVSMSEDCGDYLCNFLFYRSCASIAHAPGFTPAFSMMLSAALRSLQASFTCRRWPPRTAAIRLPLRSINWPRAR